jgi:hypothetical protein
MNSATHDDRTALGYFLCDPKKRDMIDLVRKIPRAYLDGALAILTEYRRAVAPAGAPQLHVGARVIPKAPTLAGWQDTGTVVEIDGRTVTVQPDPVCFHVSEIEVQPE